MKQTDDNIRELFSSKLGDAEVDVSPELWQNISGKLASQGASSAAGGIGGLKIFLAAALVVGVAVGSYFVFVKRSAQENEVHTELKKDELASEEKPASQNLSESWDNPVESATQGPSTIQIEEKQEKKFENNNSASASEEFQQVSEQFKLEEEISKIADGQMNIQPSGDITAVGNDGSKGKPEEMIDVEIDAEFTIVAVDKAQRRYFFMPRFAEANEYHWDFGDGLTSDEKSPAHSYEEDGPYEVRLSVKDKAGKTRESVQQVEAFQTGVIVIPNIFTPDGDGYNDKLDVLERTTGVQIRRILVFDLNGNQVFESDGSVLWDGNNKVSQPCPAGTYRCIVSGLDRNQDLIEKRMNVFLSR